MLNAISLMGRLTRDPETRYAAGDQGTAITKYTLAVDRDFKRDGQPEADFINITSFGKKAEFAGTYFKKGKLVVVHGSLHTGSYKDKEGRTVYTADVYADQQYFAEKAEKKEPESPAPAPDPKPKKKKAEPVQQPMDLEFEETDEDLPF